MSVYSTRVQPDTSGAAMDDGEESTAAAAAGSQQEERKQAGTTRHEHMQRMQRQRVAPLALGHSLSNSALAATPTLSGGGGNRPQSRLGGDGADDVASVMPPTPLHRLMSDGVNSMVAPSHRPGRSSQSPLQSPRSPPPAEPLMGGLAGVGVSLSVSQRDEVNNLDETLSQRVLASEPADDEEALDHNERVATQEVKALGEAVSMAPGPGSKGRRGSSSTVSSSSAGGLVASLAPIATAAVPMDDVVAPVAVDFSASVAAAAAAHDAPVSPTSVASQFSNPSSGKPKFSLVIRSVGPKEEDNDEGEADEDGQKEEQEDEQANDQDEPAAAAAPRSSTRTRKSSEKAASAQQDAKTAAASAAAAAAAPASPPPAAGHSAVAQRRSEAAARKKLEEKAANKAAAQKYRALMNEMKGKKTKAESAPAARPAARSNSRGGKATKRESSAEADVTISVPPAKKARQSRSSAAASTSAAAAAATAAASSDSAPPSPSASPELSGPLNFPPVSAQLSSSFFEDDGFPSFVACDPSLPAALYTKFPRVCTRAPSSQSLHAVRVAIYRELAEEYFGRYMKESPDAEEQPEGAAAAAAAAASHTPAKHHRRAKQAAAPKVDSRGPEQLRMLFFDVFNECEQDRIPSTAGRSELTGLTIVNPIDPTKQLVSFGATDISSMARESAPATYDAYLRYEHARKQQSQSPPLPLNPHFDLYQYAPLVPSDEYEEVATQLTQLMEGEDDHPTLRAPTTKGVSYKRGEAEATESDLPAATASAAASSHSVAAMDIDLAPAAASNGLPAVAPVAAAGALSVPAAVAVPVAVKSEGDVSPSSMKVEAEASPAAAPMADGIANGSAPVAAAAAAASSNSTGAAAAVPASAASVAAPLSLPPTAHGVGMLGALDFESSGVRSYRDHWANSCFAWRFENASRNFSAHAYSTANAAANDAAIVANLLSTNQARFHAQLQTDEAEEAAYEASLRLRGRQRKSAKPESEVNEESKNGHSEANGAAAAAAASASAVPTGIPATGAYSRDSPEWDKLKRRLRTSLEDSLAGSLFLPHTYLRDVSPKLHDRAQRMARECVAHLQSKVVLPAGEKCVDDVFKLVVPGFGCAGVQVFLKIGLCVTLLHDEIGWCSALNYMTSRSRGAALWIGLNMHKASTKLSKDNLRTLINATTFNLSEFLPKLRKLGLQPSMQVQTPGTCIYSPSGRGSAHIVITVGSWVEQIAINYSMSAAGLVSALNFWDGVDPLLHNSALATRCVVPLVWLAQHRKWDLGPEIADQLLVLSTLVRAVKREGQHKVSYRDFDDPNDVELTCASCFKKRGAGYMRALLYVCINGMCPSCFVDSTKEYTHFANMIDRKFK